MKNVYRVLGIAAGLVIALCGCGAKPQVDSTSMRWASEPLDQRVVYDHITSDWPEARVTANELDITKLTTDITWIAPGDFSNVPSGTITEVRTKDGDIWRWDSAKKEWSIQGGELKTVSEDAVKWVPETKECPKCTKNMIVSLTTGTDGSYWWCACGHKELKQAIDFNSSTTTGTLAAIDFDEMDKKQWEQANP